MEKENVKIGYKIFAEHNKKLYSYFSRNSSSLSNEEMNYCIKYNKKNWIKGKPWIALFKTEENAKEWAKGTKHLKIYKVEYTPFDTNRDDFYFFHYINFLEAIAYNGSCKIYYEKWGNDLNDIPKDTIFAEKIKLIEKIK